MKLRRRTNKRIFRVPLPGAPFFIRLFLFYFFFFNFLLFSATFCRQRSLSTFFVTGLLSNWQCRNWPRLVKGRGYPLREEGTVKVEIRQEKKKNKRNGPQREKERNIKKNGTCKSQCSRRWHRANPITGAFGTQIWSQLRLKPTKLPPLLPPIAFLLHLQMLVHSQWSTFKVDGSTNKKRQKVCPKRKFSCQQIKLST